MFFATGTGVFSSAKSCKNGESGHRRFALGLKRAWISGVLRLRRDVANHGIYPTGHVPDDQRAYDRPDGVYFQTKRWIFKQTGNKRSGALSTESHIR